MKMNVEAVGSVGSEELEHRMIFEIQAGAFGARGSVPAMLAGEIEWTTETPIPLEDGTPARLRIPELAMVMRGSLVRVISVLQVGDEWHVRALFQGRTETMSKSKKKLGKGVAALTDVPGGLKMDPKNVRRRERHAEKVASRDKRDAARQGLDEIREQADLKAGIDPKDLKEIEKLEEGAGVSHVTFYDGMSEHAAERLKSAIDAASRRPRRSGFIGPKDDEPVPVRLTLVALAKAFDEACAVTEWRQAELDAAVREQAKAKQALDQAINRRANGERA